MATPSEDNLMSKIVEHEVRRKEPSYLGSALEIENGKRDSKILAKVRFLLFINTNLWVCMCMNAWQVVISISQFSFSYIFIFLNAEWRSSQLPRQWEVWITNSISMSLCLCFFVCLSLSLLSCSRIFGGPCQILGLKPFASWHWHQGCISVG